MPTRRSLGAKDPPRKGEDRAKLLLRSLLQHAVPEQKTDSAIFWPWTKTQVAPKLRFSAKMATPSQSLQVDS